MMACNPRWHGQTVLVSRGARLAVRCIVVARVCCVVGGCPRWPAEREGHKAARRAGVGRRAGGMVEGAVSLRRRRASLGRRGRECGRATSAASAKTTSGRASATARTVSAGVAWGAVRRTLASSRARTAARACWARRDSPVVILREADLVPTAAAQLCRSALHGRPLRNCV